MIKRRHASTTATYRRRLDFPRHQPWQQSTAGVFSEGDYLAFLKALGDLKQRKPFELYGYWLMSNHIHLVIRPLTCTISRVVQSLLVSHTQRYHRFHGSGGHVWQGRFKSPVVQDDEHLLTLLRYVEANPLRAKLVQQAGEYR